jgi:hypothetical protein
MLPARHPRLTAISPTERINPTAFSFEFPAASTAVMPNDVSSANDGTVVGKTIKDNQFN